MQKGNKKEKWGKPKLIILTRGKPEERVLTTCKTAAMNVMPTRWAGACAWGGLIGMPCSDCAYNVTS